MIVSIIVAMTKQKRVIGLNNKMPWHLPADLAWFKQCTLNKPIIMGHKTFDSIGRLLPNRHNIIISRQDHPSLSDNMTWAKSIDDALSIAKAQQFEAALKEVFIIGGGSIYQQSLPLADKLYLTHIDADLQGDTYFHDYQPERWQSIYQLQRDADENNQYACLFEILSRKKVN